MWLHYCIIFCAENYLAAPLHNAQLESSVLTACIHLFYGTNIPCSVLLTFIVFSFLFKLTAGVMDLFITHPAVWARILKCLRSTSLMHTKATFMFINLFDYFYYSSFI